jgi:predicted transcriptional regulator
MEKANTRWLTDPDQMRLLTSAIRLEIIDTLLVNGPSSVADLARELARPADSLYYHIHKLLNGGLLSKEGLRKTSRRDEILYRVDASRVRFKYDTGNSEINDIIRQAVRSMMRTSSRDFDEGLGADNAVSEGPARNIWAGRFKAWLSEDDLKTLNHHLHGIIDILLSSRREEGHRLHSVSMVITPLSERSSRR